jgi:hypothetical protein
MENGAMLSTIQGVYRDGSVQLTEQPRGIPDDTPVIVTFLSSSAVDLRSRGIDEAEAADLRARLSTFAEDWDSPDMNAYDDYDAAKAKLCLGVNPRL